VEFASPEHEAFFLSEAPEIVASGWMGAGKSRILCEKAWFLAQKYPAAQFGIFRKVAASLPATTERTFWRDVAEPNKIVKRNKSENWLELHNGSRIYFLGLDPDPITGAPSKVGSLDLACAFVDEAVELTESDWIMLQGRLRDPRMPWHQLAAATNPGPPKHWLKMRFTPPTPDREWYPITDNRFLGPDYLERLAQLGDSAAAQRLGKGLWVGAEGVIWTLPDHQIQHVEPPFHHVHGAVDWGFVHAFAGEILGQSGTGRLHVIAEVYERGATVNDLIPHLKAMGEMHRVEMWYADPSEPGYILDCQRAGIPMVPAVNDVLPGITAVSDAIAHGLTVDPSCVGLLNEMPGYTWKPERGGGLQERPIEINDDACDALRYGVMSFGPGTNPFSIPMSSAGGIA
jgi:phage terminase large subunit